MYLFFQPTSPIIDPAFGVPSMGLAAVNVLGVPEAIEVQVYYDGGVSSQFSQDDFTGQWVAIPEPTTLVLAGLGIIAFIFFRHRIDGMTAYT